jgi:hypothetical protein
MIATLFISAMGYLLLLSLSTSAAAIKAAPVPFFPLQFSAEISITAHLIEEDSEYPPRMRKMRVYYDYINKLARADIDAGMK